MIGKENLTAQRTAVFIFNHRNQADLVIAGALARDNCWGGQELASDLIMARWEAATVFIDRDDRSPRWRHCAMVESARHVTTIVIALLGCSVGYHRSGSFKKALPASPWPRRSRTPIVIRGRDRRPRTTTINPARSSRCFR